MKIDQTRTGAPVDHLTKKIVVKIFSNPRNLTIKIDEKKGKYAPLIILGRGSGSKALFQTPHGLSKAEALLMMQEALGTCQTEGVLILNEAQGEFFTQMSEANVSIENPHSYLNLQLIKRIMLDLENKGEVETYNYV